MRQNYVKVLFQTNVIQVNEHSKSHPLRFDVYSGDRSEVFTLQPIAGRKEDWTDKLKLFQGILYFLSSASWGNELNCHLRKKALLLYVVSLIINDWKNEEIVK